MSVLKTASPPPRPPAEVFANTAADSYSRRIESLDVFRGLTMAAMIVVNNPGSWSSVYPPLLHADWDGLTPTDLIFPFFIFIVGVCIPLSLRKCLRSPAGTGVDVAPAVGSAVWRIVRRFALIFLIGLVLLGAFPYSGEAFRTIRIPGVLQRIALCYLATSLLFLGVRWRGQIVIAAGLLLGYWILLTTIAAPGYEAGDLSREGSLPSWVDRTVLAGHTWKKDYDPEGILSTLPAIASCLIGLLAGQWLLSGRSRQEIASGLFAFGVLTSMTGCIWSLVFPINKALWTSSFVLVTSGLGMLLLGLCYWLIDIHGRHRWAAPFRILGLNALVIYVLVGFTSDVIGHVQVTAGGQQTSLKGWLYQSVFAPRLSPMNASLAFALCYLAVWMTVAWALYRRRIFFRV